LCGIRIRICVFSSDFRLRHLDGAVERQLPGHDPLEGVEHGAEGVVALQHLAAEAAAGDLDLAGEVHLLLAVEQRNLAHLGEVHPHRVVDVPAIPVGVLERGLHPFRGERLVHLGDGRDGLAVLVGVHIGNAVGLDVLLDLGQPLRFGHLRQRLIHLVVGERAGLLALLDQLLDDRVVLPVHPEPPVSCGRPAASRRS